jgi:hypothetical protein
VAVARLASKLGLDSGVLAGYGDREQTRTDHLREVMSYAGWRSADRLVLKELDEFLLARAMEHDSPLLFRLACEHLITSRVLRPGPVKLLERVATARARRSATPTIDWRVSSRRRGVLGWTRCWRLTRRSG